MFRFSKEQVSYSSWLNDLASEMNVTVNDGYVEIPSHLGEGFLFAMDITKNMSFVMMDIKMKEDFVFERLKTTGKGLVTYFNLADVSEYMRVKHGDKVLEEGKQQKHSVFVTSLDYDLEMYFSPESRIRCISLFHQESSIKKVIKRDLWMCIHDYLSKGFENLNGIHLSAEMKQIMNNIFDTSRSHNLFKLIVINRILYLHEKFFNLFVCKQNGMISKKINASEIERIQAIGRLLMECPDEEFPSIAKLSEMASMSSASLKRKFQEVYGLPPYGLYRKTRMERAYDLIQRKKFSLKEIAAQLGYSNPSNFSREFKKFFGFLPSAVPS